jgi:hypothetical protein
LVPENVGVNKNGVNQSDIPIRKKRPINAKKMPKGVKLIMRESKLISDVHWQGAFKRKGIKQTSIKKGWVNL